MLSVRAYYHHDSLCVEVLNAKDVIPLDTNGKRVPYHVSVSGHARSRFVWNHLIKDHRNVHFFIILDKK